MFDEDTFSEAEEKQLLRAYCEGRRLNSKAAPSPEEERALLRWAANARKRHEVLMLILGGQARVTELNPIKESISVVTQNQYKHFKFWE